MNPTIELRLRTMIRAMTEVILPAVDTSDSLAQEQAQLLVGHLHALLQHHALEGDIDALEKRALRELANALTAASAGGSATMAASERLQNLPETTDAGTTGHAIEALVIAAGVDGSEAFQTTSAALVLDHGRTAALRGRAWFRPMGFDPTPDALPDIPTLLQTPENQS